MASPTHPNGGTSADEKALLEAQIRDCYGRICFSHKTHEKHSDCLLQRSRIFRLLQIFLSAVTTGGLIAVLLRDSESAKVISVLASTILLGLNAYLKDHDLSALSQMHARTGAVLWGIRESYLSLLTDLRDGSLALQQVRDKRDRLQADLEKVYVGAPRTTSTSYGRAQKALQKEEELTFTDSEIDALLPPRLRWTKHTDAHSW